MEFKHKRPYLVLILLGDLGFHLTLKRIEFMHYM